MATARFAPELRSATEARRFVEDELRPAGAGEDTLCHAQLLVTELVTNAARHAQSAVDLTIAGDHGRVRIEAHDDSSSVPIAPRVDTETRHRGLQLIEDLSEGGESTYAATTARPSGVSWPARASPGGVRSAGPSCRPTRWSLRHATTRCPKSVRRRGEDDVEDRHRLQ
jgi:two-component sensor histidine kinase